MGRTHRYNPNPYDDDKQRHRKGKKSNHAGNKHSGGIKIINDPFENDDEDYFDEEVYVSDKIDINITRGA